jgi:hypothetical protein
MYNDLDSRALGRADCYAQRFMRPGDYHYNVVPGHAQALSTDYSLVIRVEEGEKKSAQMVQHTLGVSQHGKGCTVTSATLTIATGDMVVWNGGGEIPFAVISDKAFFNSSRMVNECGFSHAFGTPGDYHWRDAFGSKLSGVVRVRDPNCKKDPDLKKWRETLAKGNVVMITEDKTDHDAIDILTGQTVFFAITKTSGISITDARLLERGEWKDPRC